MNLFEISKDLQLTLMAIEENEGELTPELEEALAVNEENLKEKLKDYVSVINSTKADIEACKIEAKRIAEVKTRKEKLVERLSKLVSEAVIKFGDTTKSGGKYMDFPTYKLSVKESETCEVNNDMIDMYSSRINTIIYKLGENNQFGLGVNYKPLLCNKLNEDNEFKVSEKELENIKFELTFRGNLIDLFDPNNEGLLIAATKERGGIISYSASKSDCKNTIKNGTFLPFANITKNNNLTIK